MKKLFTLALPLLLFISCEDEEATEDSMPLTGGTWKVNSIMYYQDSDVCEGDFGYDILETGWELSLSFSDSGIYTYQEQFNLSSDSLCSHWNGVLINNGTDCFDELIDSAYATISIDSLCIELGGEYVNDNCSGSESLTSNYTLEGQTISFAESSDEENFQFDNHLGCEVSFSITGNELEFDVDTDCFESSSECFTYSATKD